MIESLKYSPEEDNRVILDTEVTIAGKRIRVEAGTVAGRRTIDAPQKPNEDSFSVRWNNTMMRLAVFDGTSSLKPIRSLKQETGARFASHFLKEKLEFVDLNPETSEVLEVLNEQLLERVIQFEGTSLSDTHTLPASTATIVDIFPGENRVKVSHVGDSFCIVYKRGGSSEFITIDKNREYDTNILRLMEAIAKERNIPEKHEMTR